jgi:XTP/dITP diphosphohydrolase
VALAKWLTEHKSDEWRVTSDKNQARRRKSSHVTCHPSPDTFCVLADDSGLEVDAMHGAPGVQSARFAALGGQANSSDSANNAKLLRLLKDVPAEQRAARFRCVIALVAVQHLKSEIRSPKLFEGVCEGRIAFAPRGKRGFGYDPLFVPDGFDKTFAELGAEVKNRMSHRARALAKLKSALEVNALSLP